MSPPRRRRNGKRNDDGLNDHDWDLTNVARSEMMSAASSPGWRNWQTLGT